METLQDALKLTTAVAVHVVSENTTLSQDGNAVLTTYTVRIIDNISYISFAKANAKPDSAILPSAVGAPPPNTFHVLVHGGTTVIDGITIAIPERPTPLSIGDDYLLFIRLEKNRDGAPIRLGTLPIGDAGVFKYDPATDTISPTGGKHNKDLVSKIMKTSGGLYSSLRGIIVAGGALTSGVQR